MRKPQQSYWDERLKQNWGPHGVGSLVYGRQYNTWLYRVRRRAFMGLCRSLKLRPLESRILDVGCGTGFYIEQWRRLGADKIVGLDFSAVVIERLRRQFPPAVSLEEMDIGEPTVPLPAGSFDIVTAFDVLFHIVDDDRYDNALRNISTILHPGGLFLYSDNFIHGQPREYQEYWKSRSLGDIGDALDRAGFQILDRVPVFVLMNSPVDSGSQVFQLCWDFAMKSVSRSEVIGFTLGALLYPLELILRRFVNEGPSTEIMVCRKT